METFCDEGADSLPDITLSFEENGSVVNVTIPSINLFPYSDSSYVSVGVSSESNVMVLGVPFFMSSIPVFN